MPADDRPLGEATVRAAVPEPPPYSPSPNDPSAYSSSGDVVTDHDRAPIDVTAICGSMRLWPQMLEAAAHLARCGTVALLPTPCPDGDKAVLARLHQRRIDMADDVLVVGEPGEDTAEETAYAVMKGKPVYYTEERHEHVWQRVAGDGEDTVMGCACGDTEAAWS